MPGSLPIVLGAMIGEQRKAVESSGWPDSGPVEFTAQRSFPGQGAVFGLPVTLLLTPLHHVAHVTECHDI